MTAQNTDLALIIYNSLETFKTGGVILSANNERSQKAIAVGNKILADVAAYKEANGGKLSQELDERMMKYITNCNGAKAEMNDARKPITQTFTIISSEFTRCENEIDVAKAGTPANRMQAERNAFVRQLAEEKKEQERKAQLEADKRQEAINIKAECEKRLLAYFGGYLVERKTALNTNFNQLTLADIEERGEKLKELSFAYPYAHYQTFKHGLSGRYHSPEEIETLLFEPLRASFQPFADRFKQEMETERAYLVDRLPSKKKELEDIAEYEKEQAEERERQRLRDEEMAKANENERIRLAEQQKVIDRQNEEREQQRKLQLEEQAKREEEERQRVLRETQENNAAAEQQIINTAALETTMSLFEQTADSAVATTAMPEVRTGFKINILNNAAFVEIFQFWFTRESGKLTTEKMLNTKLDGMKTYCEKAAKAGDKIVSKNLSYEEDFSAVNRKK